MTDKKKILFFVQLPPPVHGVSVTNEKIIKSNVLRNSGIEIDVLPLRFSTNIEDIDRLDFKKILKTFAIVYELFLRCLLSRPSIVYFTLSVMGNTFYRDTLFVSILKFFRVNIVYHLHRVGVEQAGKKSKLRHFLYKWVFSNTQVIHLTPGLYEDIHTYIDRRYCYFVSNGIEDPRGKASPPSVHRKNDVVHFVFLSHMVVEKGVIVMLDALEELKRRGLNYTATFAGGRMSDEVKLEFTRRSLSHEIDERIRYVGPLYNKEKDDLFADADVFVFPSLYDSFGIVLLEAMAYSLPVVSTFQGGIPDVVDNGVTGFLVNKNDSIQLADMMEKLAVDDSLRKEMGASGRKKFEQQYTTATFELNILEALILCIENRRH